MTEKKKKEEPKKEADTYKTRTGKVVDKVGRQIYIPADIYKRIKEANYISNRDNNGNDNIEGTIIKLIGDGLAARGIS